MTERIVATGKIFELVRLPQPDGHTFELARRAPGVRVIIADPSHKKVLLTREFRTELNDYDYRLPGGKVFDTWPNTPLLEPRVKIFARRCCGRGLAAASR